jgi:hypothetical protein
MVMMVTMVTSEEIRSEGDLCGFEEMGIPHTRLRGGACR